ncbi:MAG: hypothetical protein QOF16_1619 [Actinomycetota bacterium]|jgi:magnesium-transporting ATPase (P-type)|nr:hypothetical protein [Actinomycetota bacterium]
MDFRRLAAFGGIGFVVLQVFANAIPGGTPPGLTDSPQKVVSFFADKHSTLLLGNAANTLSTIFVVVFFVGLYNLLRRERPEPTEMWPLVGLIGLILTAGFVSVGQAFFTMSIFQAKDVPGATAIFNQMAVITFTLSGIFLATMLVGFGMAALRSALLPSWLGQFALLGALAGTVASVGAGRTNDIFTVMGFVAFLLFLLWVLAASVMLMRSTQEPAVSTA